ncbi:FUN14 domain-containing protein [Deinococcus petrolearius]|uniref:FUN14 domain-containing protein n=1 Tax=Deinococcus petrolearius TaxID=1751295 RepID=A0ABW1DMT1_9DEIO
MTGPAALAALTAPVQAALPDLSLGGVLGVACGLALRAAGGTLLISLGLLFIAVQLLAWAGIVTVDWPRLGALSGPWLRAVPELWQGLLRVLTDRLPFAGAFGAGLLLGLRLRR